MVKIGLLPTFLHNHEIFQFQNLILILLLMIGSFWVKNN